MAGKNWILILFLFLGFKGLAQSISYTYTDPCTGVQNTVTLSSASGTTVMFYAGQYQVFTMAQLQSGAYEAWIAQINAAAPPGSNPCAGNAGAVSGTTTATVGTNVVSTVGAVSSTLSSLGGSVTTSSGGMDVGGSTGGSSTNSSSNNDQNNESSSSSDDSGSNSNDSSTDSGSSNDGSTGSSSSGSSSSSSSSGSGDTGGGSTSGGSGGDTGGSSSGSSGSTDGGSSSGSSSGGGDSGPEANGTSVSSGDNDEGSSAGGAIGDKDIDAESGGQSDSDSEDSGGSGGGKKKGAARARKGSLVASGDIVAIRNGSDYKQGGNDNFKINMGVTYANTKQTFAAGTLLNYTTGQNEFALTGYGSYKNQYAMLVGSNSFLYNHSQKTWFNTGNVMYAMKGSKYHTVLLGTNFSFGQLGKENFSNWAANAGIFTTFNGYKGVSVNLMGIAMYSPFTFFYEGQWFQGGFLFIPLSSFDFAVTDTFKFNISTSTVYLAGEGILNFQLMTGTKMLL